MLETTELGKKKHTTFHENAAREVSCNHIA